jgi:hypothetical protein
MAATPPTRHFRFRRSAVIVAALAAGAGGLSLAAAGPAAAIVVTRLSLSLPSAVGDGGDLQSGSATINNSSGGDVAAARVDFDITPNAGTPDLVASDFVIKYETSPGSGVYQVIPLTADASGGGVHGFFGPAAGFPIPHGATNTTNLQVTANPGAPSGGITVTADLDTTPGDTTSDIATATAGITLSTPTMGFPGFPSSLTPGGGFSAFMGTLANNTGSDYGGPTPSNSPSPAGVRLDFSVASSNSAVPASDVTLDYCLSGTGSTCTGGTWQAIPLSDNGSGTYTGYFGPTGGFALPNTATNSTPFRVSAAAATPTTTLTTVVTLDKVDSTGSTATPDSAGVADGTILRVQAGITTITATTGGGAGGGGGGASTTATTTHLTFSENPAKQGDTVTAIATVSPASAGGSVQFSVDGSKLGGLVPLSGGTATIALPTTLSVGNHTVNASYSGDAQDAASGDSATLMVAAANPNVKDPTITSQVHSAHAISAAGWYRGPVSITYTCTPGSAPLDSAGCPSSVTLRGNGGHIIRRTVTATDGGSATAVNAIAIDHAAPHLHLSGAKSGHTYAHHRRLHVSCRDHLSGIAACTVTSHRHGNKVTFDAIAVDKAGNVTERSGRYTIS